MKGSDVRRHKIIEAARKRFSHFGIAKTTMAEIAHDLALSKALLYYYYPDKNALYAAVIDDVIDDFTERLQAVLNQDLSVFELTEMFLDTRITHIKNHYHIFSYIHSIKFNLPPDLRKVVSKVVKMEEGLMKELLIRGVERGELEIEDQEEVATLLHVAILGTQIAIVDAIENPSLPPTKTQFDAILILQKKMAKIFLNGLRRS